MAASIEKGHGDQVALFINGDLQFDSTDERIYHEALALPALALAAKRNQLPLKVLVIGGGDGLIAREMFKSAAVASLDLVDYDPQILSFAKNDLSSINQGSLFDPRITIYNQDAWEFADRAIDQSSLYDVIVSDLTVAANVMEARFHSVEWYAKLARLLSAKGILSVNGVSPQATPQAYWCIFNSMVTAALHARPYHVNLPSFSAQGYGDDWGFLIASPMPIKAEEFDIDLCLATPRQFLRSNSDLLPLFAFPEELFAFQSTSSPALAGSDILLHYFNNAAPLTAHCGALRYTLDLDSQDMAMPAPDSGKHILPPALCSAVAKSIQSSEQYDTTRPEGAQLFLHEVLDLMPSLQKEQTAALISDFLQAPTRFLQAIDLPGLVARLLTRAAELPSQLVAELKHLQGKLEQWTGDPDNLLTLGHRAISILILAIVVGNLFYPDAAYGKGASHSNSSHRTGARGGYYGGGWGGTTYYNNRRNTNPVKKGPIGPGPNDAAVKRMQKEGSLPQPNDLSDAEYSDQGGNKYPARRYRTAAGVELTKAVYRLAADADILADGNIAMPLTDSSYLLLMPQETRVIEQQSGDCLISLRNDPQLLSQTISEISRQLSELAEAKEQPQVTRQNALQILLKANSLFQNTASVNAGSENANLEDQVPASIAAGGEVLPGVHLTADGQYLAVARADGQIAYMDGKNWYSAPGASPLDQPYPTRFRSAASSYLQKLVRDTAATTNMLLADKHELTANMDMLASELAGYEASSESLVNFGTKKLPRGEAIKMAQLAVRRAEQQIKALNQSINSLPEDIGTAKVALSILDDDGRA